MSRIEISPGTGMGMGVGSGTDTGTGTGPAGAGAGAGAASGEQDEIARTLERWRAVERDARTRLGPAGVSALDEIRRRSGLEFLQAMASGELPSAPIGHTLDFFPVEVEPGRVVFQGLPGPQHYNPIGSVHGGWIATLLDSAVACAVQTMLPAGRAYTTLELKVNFVRAVTDRTGPVRAEGKVITAGRQAGTAEGRLVDAAGKLYAFATTTCLVFEL